MTEESMKDVSQDVTDKIQAGIKAMGKKLKEPDKETNIEYDNEILKEKADNF